MDFACRKFNLDEVIRCSLNLTKAEFKILEFLMKNSAKRFSTEEIVKNIDLDLSTVQRSMKKMSARKIVKRSQVNLKSGYAFLYCICEKKEIKKIIKDILKSWVDKFESEIEKW